MIMTVDKARQLLDIQVSFGGYYNRNSMRMILADIQREHGILPGVKLSTPGN